MTAPTFDLDAIEQAAKAATQGEWVADHLGGVFIGIAQVAMACGQAAMRDERADTADILRANAAHIAACSPAVVLAMCARLRWAERLEAACRVWATDALYNEARVNLRAVLAEKPE